MDSRVSTYQHIHQVQAIIDKVVADLVRRRREHDQSKLVPPEVSYFDEYTPKLSGITYGSEQYKACLDAMKPGLDHHYAVNDHHPEHYGYPVCVQCGARDVCSCGGPRRATLEKMSLVSLLEMLCDWKAASLRHADGDIRRSIDENQKRFGYSDELKQLMLNTLPLLEE